MTLPEAIKKYAINLRILAEYSGVSYGMLRHYATGEKVASPARLKKIEEAINDLGGEMSLLTLEREKK